MKTLLIVYHSLTGGTRQMAEAAAAGAAAESGVAVRLLQAAAAGPGDVLAADGYVFAAPENLAALAGTDEGFLRPLLLSGPWPDQRAALRPFDMRWQRWRKCGPADSAHRDRVAFAGRGGTSHRLYARPNARGDPRAEGHRRKRSRSMPHAGRHAFRGARHGGVLRRLEFRGGLRPKLGR